MTYYNQFDDLLPPQRLALVTVHVVPPIAREDRLVEQGSVAAQERASLVSLSSVVADVIRLASRLRVGIHSRNGRDVVTAERGLWHGMVDREIMAGHSWQFAQVLSLFLLYFVLVGTADDDRSVIVVDLLVLRLGVLRGHRSILGDNGGTSQRLLVVLRSR